VWARGFVEQLEATRRSKSAQRLRIARLEEQIRKAQRPLLLLAFDGTLRPFVGVPAEAAPTPRLLRILRQLATRGRVYVVTGRRSEELERWLGELPVGLVAELGLSTKEPGAAWSAKPALDRRILDEVIKKTLQEFTERTPGSQIEDKTASLVWHYRGVDPELRTWRANELVQILRPLLAGSQYSVVGGSKTVEIRHFVASQAAAIGRILELHQDADLVFAAGTEPADSEMLEIVETLNISSFSDTNRSFVCRVGSQRGSCFVETCEELLQSLESLAAAWSNEEQAAHSASPTQSLGRGT
jgi:trehalose 6-phosphate synthase/phosphatase